jgi:hypothetical protein
VLNLCICGGRRWAIGRHISILCSDVTSGQYLCSTIVITLTSTLVDIEIRRWLLIALVSLIRTQSASSIALLSRILSDSHLLDISSPSAVVFDHVLWRLVSSSLTTGLMDHTSLMRLSPDFAITLTDAVGSLDPFATAVALIRSKILPDCDEIPPESIAALKCCLLDWQFTAARSDSLDTVCELVCIACYQLSGMSSCVLKDTLSDADRSNLLDRLQQERSGDRILSEVQTMLLDKTCQVLKSFV